MIQHGEHNRGDHTSQGLSDIWWPLVAVLSQGMAHQVNDVIQLEEVADLVAAVDEADEPGAHLGRNRVNGVANDVVQQLI